MRSVVLVTSDETPEEPGASEDVPVESASPADAGAGEPERTLKDYLLEEDAADFKFSPEVRKRIASAMTPSMGLMAQRQTASALKVLQAAERSGALRNLKVGQNALAGLKVADIRSPALEKLGADLRIPAFEKLRTDVRIPALEGLKTSFGLSDRLREQIAASLPASRISAQFAPLQASIAKSVLPRVEFAMPKIPPLAFSKLYGREWAPIATKLANIQKLYDRVDFDRLFSGWFPPNWDRGRGVEQYHDFIELAEAETLPLTWVPNTELTYLLLEAESAEARAELLLEHSSAIVADCRAVLDDFDNETHLVTGLRTALDTYEAGFHEPAQSYAASILDTALREAFAAPKRWSYPNVRKLLHTGKDWRALALRSARLVPTSAALRGLLEDFWTDRGDPIPTSPNRHASAHAVHPDQFNQVNAIKFLMLATAMLAEMEYDGWARILALPSEPAA